MPPYYDALARRLRDVQAVRSASALLGWDQQVLMPGGGARARAHTLSVLARMSHELFTADETGRLLDAAALEVADLPYDSDEASLVRVMQADYTLATKLPSQFVAEQTALTSAAHEIWAHARAASDFSQFQPTLEKIIDMKRREADYLSYAEHPYDAMIDQYERGATAASVKAIFDAHKPDLIALIGQVRANADRVDASLLHRHYPKAAQEAFARGIVGAMGFDFTRGRQDVSVHPFCISFSNGDVRITTRYSEDFLNPALFGMIHETGHAMYEQGSPDALDDLPLGGGTSLGVHESQSRMWENIVGRSYGFWSWAYPQAQAAFPDALADVSLDQFYRAVNAVGSSFIRVEADEATYNLHIMLRFELEMDLITGAVQVADLPRAWNERFEAMFGIVPPNDAQGVLQDVHWSSGLFGYFATYALGNMLAAQYYNEALKAHPAIPDEIGRGEFGTLLGWLRTNIHQHARKFTSAELTQRITGGAIASQPYTDYLRAKYTPIYGL
jgi:carboxypeptidase Taq